MNPKQLGKHLHLYPGVMDWYISTIYFLQFLISTIVTALILEHACLPYDSSSKPTLSELFDSAFKLYHSTGIHKILVEEFPSHQRLSIEQTIDFILKNRIS
jgi:hypothetical protein